MTRWRSFVERKFNRPNSRVGLLVVAVVFCELVVDGRRVGVDPCDGTDDRREYGDHVHECADRGALVLRPERQIGQCRENHGERHARH